MKKLLTLAAGLVLTAAASAPALAQSTLDKIKARGHIICGASEGVPGFSLQDKNGTWVGFDTDVCRALAAAIFNDPTKATYLSLSSKNRLVALQSGDPATLARWREIVAESEKAFRDIYGRLGVLLTPADSVGESFYNPMLASTIDELIAAGIVVESDGALVIFSQEVNGPQGDPVPLMVRKSDGGYGYDTTDLATIRYRIHDLKADRLLYVTDARQALHFRLIFEAARRVGWLHEGIDATHVAYGTVLGPDGRPFKTRAGGTVRLMGLLDDAVARARAVVTEKNPEISPADADQIAESAGIGAVKYADLSTSRVKDYAFDVDRMVSLAGNTGVYLQYAHARIRSILRRAGEPEVTIDHRVPLEPAERALALELDGYGTTLAEVSESLEPHRLCGYLYDLARGFTSFCSSFQPTTAASSTSGCEDSAASTSNGETYMPETFSMSSARPQQM